MALYSRLHIGEENIKPPFRTDDITDQHKNIIKSENETFFNYWSIDKIRKCCGIIDKNMALFLNEAEYFKWWDQWYHKGMGIYDKYHFYLDYITNLGGCNFVQKSDPFYDADISNYEEHRNEITFGGFTKKEILNDYFIREGKGYHLLDMTKKFYESNGYKQKYDQIMNFAKNQMVYLEEDSSE